MTSPCHIYTKTGQGKRAVVWLRRLFAVLAKPLKSGRNQSTNKKPNSQLTNAEYHITAREMARITEAGLSPRDKAILLLLVETGLRRTEVASLLVEDIRWKENLLVVKNGKGGKMRLVPLTPQLKSHLSAVVGDRKGGCLFASSRGPTLSSRQINRIVAAAGSRANIRNPNPKYSQMTPHLLRHSFARLWKDRGGSIEALAKILGHKSVTTTWDLYGTMSFRDIQRNYDKIMRASRTGGKAK